METASPAPFTKRVILGSNNSVSATTPQDLNGIRYQFTGWADGGPSARQIVGLDECDVHGDLRPDQRGLDGRAVGYE